MPRLSFLSLLCSLCLSACAAPSIGLHATLRRRAVTEARGAKAHETGVHGGVKLGWALEAIPRPRRRALLADLGGIAAPTFGDHELRLAERRYAFEPSVDRVIRAALRVLSVKPEMVRRLMTRARRRGLVPEIGVGVQRGQQRDLEYPISTMSDRLRTDDEISVDIDLTFRLDQLVFSESETRLLREEQNVRIARMEIVEAVVRAYFERRRLQLERDLHGGSITDALRIEELTGLLDGFTDGAFRSMMSRRR